LGADRRHWPGCGGCGLTSGIGRGAMVGWAALAWGRFWLVARRVAFDWMALVRGAVLAGGGGWL
jgi:hypothetical protein